MNSKCDNERIYGPDVIKSLDWYYPDVDGGCFEVRILGASAYEKILSCWYEATRAGKLKALDHIVDLANNPKYKPNGYYLTINPCSEDYLAVQHSALSKAKTNTSDDGIQEVRHALLDFDPGRITDTPATDEERELSKQQAYAAAEWLKQYGLKSPLIAMSGNGYHADYKFHGGSTKEIPPVLRSFLLIMHDKFGIHEPVPLCKKERLEVDISVHNPARICKIYGLLHHKGDDTDSRYNRLSFIEQGDDEHLYYNDWTNIKAIVDEWAPKGTEKKNTVSMSIPSTTKGAKGNLSSKAGVYFLGKDDDVAPVLDGVGPGKHTFTNGCPLGDHGFGTDTVVFVSDDGGCWMNCKHDGCQNRTDQEARSALGLPEPKFTPKGLTNEQIMQLMNYEYTLDVPVEQYNPNDLAEYPFTDLGNAKRFAAMFGTKLRYIKQFQDWKHFNGKVWVDDALDECGKSAQQVWKTIPVIEVTQKNGKVLKNAEDSTWHVQSQSGTRIREMVRLAQSRLAADINTFDNNLMLFNCENGVLDLNSSNFDLMPHDPNQRLISLAPVVYDPTAKCPNFLKFIYQILDDDDDLVRTMQVWFGYCLTGDIREQKLPILHGEGNNGKSTLVTTILEIMGKQYGDTAPHNFLMEKSREEHPTELYNLMGKRLMVANESEETKTLRLALVKSLTGDDFITARRMRGDFFTFRRTSKLILVTNNLPNIKENSRAMRRRLMVVPFNVVIPDDEIDKDLGHQLLAEKSGILNWLLDGLKYWRAHGIFEPEAVKIATDKFHEDSNTFGEFLDECCELGPEERISRAEVRVLYGNWSDKNKGMKLNPQALYERIRKVPHISEYRTRSGERGFEGIGKKKSGYDTLTGEPDIDEELPDKVFDNTYSSTVW